MSAGPHGPGPGHNGGPTIQPGASWRTYCWTQARRGLLGETLPLEVIRTRVKRAQALGLPYRTYASIRAGSGRDVIGFLFSSNALRAYVHAPQMPPDRALRLKDTDALRIALATGRLSPASLLEVNPQLHDASPAPDLRHGWGATCKMIQAAKGRHPSDGIVLVGDTALEAEWAVAARLAAYLPAQDFFA